MGRSPNQRAPQRPPEQPPSPQAPGLAKRSQQRRWLCYTRLRTPADPAPILLRGWGLSPPPEWGDHPHPGASRVRARSLAAVCLHQEARATAESPGTASAGWGHCKTHVQGWGWGRLSPGARQQCAQKGPLETTGQLGRGWRSRPRPPPTAQDSAHPPGPRVLSASSSVPREVSPWAPPAPG